MIYADQRWIGDHGIGRFARRLLSALDYHPVSLTSNPASPLDPWRLARALQSLSCRDVFFSPGYNTPLFCGAPFILTLHDVNHIDRPENSSASKRVYYAVVLKPACHRAARILTVSEFSRERILDWSGVPDEKVINVRAGVDPEFHPAVAPREMPWPYLLCVSNRKRHKNEYRTVQAFASARIAPEIHLVFTGNATRKLAACIGRQKLASRVHFLGVVPDAELPGLYRGALALIFVSLYEGFGLPVVEAMACGTPVLTSNSAALPETAGGAALLVDPTNVDEIAEAIDRIAGDDGLREQLRSRGLAQAAQFSWASTTAHVQTLLAGRAFEAIGRGR